MDLSGEEEHLYRYCVVVILNNEAQPCVSQHSIVNSEANGRQKVIVRRWETHLVPRYGKIALFSLVKPKITNPCHAGKSQPMVAQMMEM